MKNKLLFPALVLAIAGAAHASETKIYSQDGQYLGKVGASPYDSESTSNPYGRYGSAYSPDSVNNPYGPYGQGVPRLESVTSPRRTAVEVVPLYVPMPTPAAAPTWDGSGLENLGAPGSGLRFVAEAATSTAAQGTPTAETAAPANTPGYVDPYRILDQYRKEHPGK